MARPPRNHLGTIGTNHHHRPLGCRGLRECHSQRGFPLDLTCRRDDWPRQEAYAFDAADVAQQRGWLEEALRRVKGQHRISEDNVSETLREVRRALLEADVNLQVTKDFIDAVKSRGNTMEDAEVGHRTTSVCHLGHIAIQRGKRLDWDPARERFADDPAADALLTGSYRAPWSL